MNQPSFKPGAQAAQQYLKARVMTATPEQLQMMLFDGAIRFCQQARTALLANNFEATYEGVSRAQKIIVELMGNLRPAESPDLCSKLSAIYSYVYKRLFEAGAKHTVASLDEAIQLMQYQRDTWMLLMQDLGKEKAASAAAKLPIPEPSERMERSISMSA